VSAPRFVLIVGLAAACGTTHTLEVSEPTVATSAEGRRDCTVGVGNFVDEAGVEFSAQLRDYLRDHGPCRNALLVYDDNDERADFVVSGHARVHMRAHSMRLDAAMGLYGGALVALLAGALMAGVAPSYDVCNHYNNAADCRSSSDASVAAGKAFAIVGGILTVAGTIDLIADRRMTLSGTIEADVAVRAGAETLANWTLKDEVKVRGSHPWGRPERRTSNEAFGILYPEFYERVFAHIAGRLDDIAAKRAMSPRRIATNSLPQSPQQPAVAPEAASVPQPPPAPDPPPAAPPPPIAIAVPRAPDAVHPEQQSAPPQAVLPTTHDEMQDDPRVTAAAIHVCDTDKGFVFCDQRGHMTENAFIRQYRDVTGSSDLDGARKNRRVAQMAASGTLMVAGGLVSGLAWIGLANNNSGQQFPQPVGIATAVGTLLWLATLPPFAYYASHRDGKPWQHTLSRAQAEAAVQRHNLAVAAKVRRGEPIPMRHTERSTSTATMLPFATSTGLGLQF
jgi:hypothetical protein